ncbi:MAG: urea ABC transporter permease subunit UrtB, partial [Pseudorhodobacter sp.]|nr:urea ABC transporter permease subunit UrtB [Pseudorhodobacter sp.]
MRTFVAALLGALLLMIGPGPATAQETPVQTLLQTFRAEIEQSSRRTIGPAIDAIAGSGLARAQEVLLRWQAREMWLRKSDGLFYFGPERRGDTIALEDVESGQAIGDVKKSDLDQLKPNSGIRAVMASALVQFQLSDPNREQRAAALTSIQRNPEAANLAPLRASIASEQDPELRAQKEWLERLLTARFDSDTEARVAAIEALSSSSGLDVRGTLNPLLTVKRRVFEGAIPEGLNVAKVWEPGDEGFTEADAYRMLVDAGSAQPRITQADILAALNANIEGGFVGGVALASLNTEAARLRAYDALVVEGKGTPFVPDETAEALLAAHVFADIYDEPSSAVTEAAEAALTSIGLRVGLFQALDLGLDALSLASIFFLAAIGLAITFGVMRVINMAHGEFIMMGAYTGYVVQQIIPDYTISILVALPLAFLVTFAAGVAMERLVIRHLYNRPLETLLATFGISIALQQIAKNIFGTQARPLTSPAWLDGAWVLNDVVSISYIRIAIFGLALIFLALFLFVMKRTRLGLETRAVTQNPAMAASMGINPDRVNMLTFGLGSGIAGIAGVAIGL